MINRTCENCSFREKSGVFFGQSQGSVCKRNAPLPKILKRSRMFDDDVYLTIWPSIDLDDRCGQWEDKL